MNNNIQKQWEQWLNKVTTSDRYFTEDLYKFLRNHCNMIAHFNRKGFIKSRFRTLADLDQTINSMLSSKIGKEIIRSTPTKLLSEARFKVAALEANILTQTARIHLQHVENLQRQFLKALT